MLSVLEVKRKLPKDFVESLYENYTPLSVDKILSGMSGNRSTTLRVNTLKYSIQDLMKELKSNNIKFERVPWFKDALIIKNKKEKDIQNLEIYDKGYIYLQSLPSMIPPLVLEPKEGEKILDMTAAPGSKTTEMAMLMSNKGKILANELDKLRCERLKYNVNMQGTEIVEVINQRGEKLGILYPNNFDKVLLDAPCSGEGRFLANDVKTYRNWSKKSVIQLAKIQKKLFRSAYDALKPGGIMVYSTCTLNKEENEDVLEWAIDNLNLKIIDIKIEIKEGISAFTEERDISIGKAIRILPSKDMEGFFVAKLKKC